MAAVGPDNPSVLGLINEQALLGEIARPGLSALGRGWEEMSFQASSGSIPTLPREAKIQGHDAVFFKLADEQGNAGNSRQSWCRRNYDCGSHSDSEVAFS